MAARARPRTGTRDSGSHPGEGWPREAGATGSRERSPAEPPATTLAPETCSAPHNPSRPYRDRGGGWIREWRAQHDGAGPPHRSRPMRARDRQEADRAVLAPTRRSRRREPIASRFQASPLQDAIVPACVPGRHPIDLPGHPLEPEAGAAASTPTPCTVRKRRDFSREPRHVALLIAALLHPRRFGDARPPRAQTTCRGPGSRAG